MATLYVELSARVPLKDLASLVELIEESSGKLLTVDLGNGPQRPIGYKVGVQQRKPPKVRAAALPGETRIKVAKTYPGRKSNSRRYKAWAIVWNYVDQNKRAEALFTYADVLRLMESEFKGRKAASNARSDLLKVGLIQPR